MKYRFKYLAKKITVRIDRAKIKGLPYFKKYGKPFILALSILTVIFFARYLNLYFITTPDLVASAWADGYKQLVGYVSANESSYDKILISGHYWQPYIYFLFYKKY